MVPENGPGVIPIVRLPKSINEEKKAFLFAGSAPHANGKVCVSRPFKGDVIVHFQGFQNNR